MTSPEQQARVQIDSHLGAAGWIVQDRTAMNLSAGTGVAVREFRVADGHGFADYMLFVDGKAVGVLEAKPAGYPLTSVELQTDKYATGLPDGLHPPVQPLPFLYMSTGIETRFINGLDPDPKTRRISGVPHIHRPATLVEWLNAETLDRWVRAPPRVWTPERLWRAYETLSKDKVRGASAERLLTDIVSLVRFATHKDEELVPFGNHVRERFERWLTQQRNQGRVFTPEQVRWLQMMRDHVATSLEMTVQDLDYAPFAEAGGRGMASQVFGPDLDALLDELNQELAA